MYNIAFLRKKLILFLLLYLIFCVNKRTGKFIRNLIKQYIEFGTPCDKVIIVVYLKILTTLDDEKFSSGIKGLPYRNYNYKSLGQGVVSNYAIY